MRRIILFGLGSHFAALVYPSHMCFAPSKSVETSNCPVVRNSPDRPCTPWRFPPRPCQSARPCILAAGLASTEYTPAIEVAELQPRMLHLQTSRLPMDWIHSQPLRWSSPH
ncbi:hypothetical protein BDW02DRAFT_241798 [Decorospora gaudefroyi]|uniref:Secreted protein n=1 Tax=Decorospora gaudefroyi TaxID=184978 RepID=A0A6A5KKX4_9PLEO|nr:hypothetical protein BDW02DRAFT_241798 [Decorospora gaudefroyi]